LSGADAQRFRLLNPSSTAAVVLGAHDWTEAGLGRAPSFLRSARRVVAYLYDPAGLGLDPELVLDLFDDPAGAGDQLARVRDTLDVQLRERRHAGNPVSDLLVYYIGHGFTDDGGHLSMLVRRSRRGLEAETGIKAPDLARALRLAAPQQRRLVMLDCCFSEAAAKAFIGMAGDLNQEVAAIAANDLGDNQPTRGTLLLCSSPLGQVSMGAPDAERTLFTGAVLEVLREGAVGHAAHISFADLRDAAYERMVISFGANAPRPALHQVNASHGDLTHIPAFPNRAAMGAKVLPTPITEATSPLVQSGNTALPSSKQASNIPSARRAPAPPFSHVTTADNEAVGQRRPTADQPETSADYDEPIGRFGSTREALVGKHVARARSIGETLRGLAWKKIRPTRHEEDGSASTAQQPDVENQPEALSNKGLRLSQLGRSLEALAAYDDLVARFGKMTNLSLRAHVAKALINKGATLGALGRNEDAIVNYDDLLVRFGAATEIALREYVARALFDKGVALGRIGRSEDECAAYDDLLTRFATATELPLREHVAMALINKGGGFGRLGRSEEAIAVYDDLLIRFGTAPELPLREHVAMALLNKGVALSKLGRNEDAMAVYDDLLVRFGTATELPLLQHVAGALVHKGIALGAMGHGERAIAAYNDLLIRFGTASGLPLREHVAVALFNKGIKLGELGRKEEEIAVYDDLLVRFDAAMESSPLLREYISMAIFRRQNCCVNRQG
jgi:tetratricopeptide (TPR) repeat protein